MVVSGSDEVTARVSRTGVNSFPSFTYLESLFSRQTWRSHAEGLLCHRRRRPNRRRRCHLESG